MAFYDEPRADSKSEEAEAMNEKEFAALLHRVGACEEARMWAKGKSLEQVWRTCKRGDWMLWLVGRMSDRDGWPTRQAVVLAACDCAATVLQYVPRNEERPANAIKVARSWAVGKASLDEVRDAANAAYAAAYAAYAAAYAANADAYAANADEGKTLKKCANLIRKSIPVPYTKVKRTMEA